MPDWMHSIVLRPSTCGGAVRLTEESCAARLVNASRDVPTPGMITTPHTSPSAFKPVSVVAVPISMTIHGPWYMAFAATAPTTRSAPSVFGTSRFTFSSGTDCALTMNGSTFQTRRTARARSSVSRGTTELKTAPFTCDVWILYKCKMLSIAEAYSSSIRGGFVAMRVTNSSFSPS